ncbi:hypothetical protein IAR55_006860 [Kwoniella newhampshirensis]|uniref:HIT-type domain-containing protein n=1 Tax=Kwoniella newhampshirensis TaxID=1651941 RepID=A0AAW0YSY0_9TREE
MSIKQPKPVQIRLPFTVPRPNHSTLTPAKTCGICRKKDSKYTCPRCNVAYCSLDCFRDESHAQCSEPFYKATVLDSIASDPKAGFDEKKGMMEMLRRFEQAQAEGGDALAELEEDDEDEEEKEDPDDELAEKLGDINIDQIDSNQLFHLLPPKHREAFLAAIRNPESEETKALIEDAAAGAEGEENALAGPSVLPWWEGDGELGSDDLELESASSPEIISDNVLAGISPPAGIGKKLAFNAIAICLAYVHTLLSFRLPSLDPTYLSAQEVESAGLKGYLGQLVPFLVDAKSTVRHETLSFAWGSVWEIIGSDQTSPSPSMLHHLLSTLPQLLHPPILASSPPKILLVLSDLYSFFSKPKAGGAVPRKLAFYIKALQQDLIRQDWSSLEHEVSKELEKLQAENEDVGPVTEQDSRKTLQIV